MEYFFSALPQDLIQFLTLLTKKIDSFPPLLNYLAVFLIILFLICLLYLSPSRVSTQIRKKAFIRGAQRFRQNRKRPFELVIGPSHWSSKKDRAYFNVSPASISNHYPKDSKLYLYPSKIKMWFIAFGIISASIFPILYVFQRSPVFPSKLTFNSLLHLAPCFCSIFVHVIVFYSYYRLAYKKYNVPVLSDYLKGWKKEYHELFHPIVSRNFSRNDSQRGKLISPPLGHDLDRQNMLLFDAMYAFFSLNPSKSSFPMIIRFGFYWTSPITASYLAIILITMTSFGVSVINPDFRAWVIPPSAIFLELAVIFIFSIVFLIRQSHYLNFNRWKILNKSAILPANLKVLHDYGNRFKNKDALHHKYEAIQKILSLINTVTFSGILVSLSFYFFTIWNYPSPAWKPNIKKPSEISLRYWLRTQENEKQK